MQVCRSSRGIRKRTAQLGERYFVAPSLMSFRSLVVSLLVRVSEGSPLGPNACFHIAAWEIVCA